VRYFLRIIDGNFIVYIFFIFYFFFQNAVYLQGWIFVWCQNETVIAVQRVIYYHGLWLGVDKWWTLFSNINFVCCPCILQRTIPVVQIWRTISWRSMSYTVLML
jgi:hypothetical protein